VLPCAGREVWPWQIKIILCATVPPLSFNKMLRRTIFSTAKLSVRNMSTESPKLTIARNLLMMEKVSEAETEAELQKLSLPTVDLKNLPAELASVADFFSQTSNASSGAKFEHDPKAWQNMKFLDFVQEEIKRPETWPFYVGFV
jgi:hypothetical protein